MKRLIAAGVALLLLAACNGPKGPPQKGVAVLASTVLDR
jgi:hypothetical protein